MQVSLGEVVDAYGYDYGDSGSLKSMELLDIAGALNSSFIDCIKEDINISSPNLKRSAEILEEIKDKEVRAYFLRNEIKFDSFKDAHNFLVKSSQHLFFARNGERWDAKVPLWISQNIQNVTNILEELGVCAEVAPQKKEYDCLAVFGANSFEMEKRLKYSYELIIDKKVEIKEGIFLLTGERYVSTRSDSSYIIDAAASHFEVDAVNVTEAHLMEKIHVDFSAASQDIAEISYYVVDTPPGDGRSRPNTDDTVIKFLYDYGDRCKNVLFVSRSPNVYAQSEAVHKVFRNYDFDIHFEVVGGMCESSEFLPENSAYHAIMPLAGAWYGGWKRVEREYYKTDQQIDQGLKYSNNCLTEFKNNSLGIY